MAELRGGTERVDLGRGYALIAPGLRGSAERLEAGAPDTRARESVTPLFDEALARTEMTSVATVEIQATPLPGSGASDLRNPRGDEALLLEVPDLGPEAGQVVLSVDEAGTVSWNFPLEGGQFQAPSDRGTGGKKRFLIRRYTPPAPLANAARDRSLFGAIGKKLLKVIVYPITDALIGKAASEIAEHWEKKNRAYGIRDFTPSNYQRPEGSVLTGDGLARLGQGQALLFIHGTFSTAHGAFSDMPADLVAALHQRYEGRIFAFNHFTLSHDPASNVRWFSDRLRALSANSRLQVDVVCHSRGGLVARVLADGHPAAAIDPNQVAVRRIVFVGAPNNGTILVQPDHMMNMIDRLSSGLNLLPPGGVADVLDGVLIAVKIIGHGALKGLDGLQCMNEKGPFLKELNKRGRRNAEYYAVAANYEPQDPGLRALVTGSIDLVVDRVFQGAENDLLVPERGVYDANGSDSFPIANNRRLRIPASDGVWHTKLFGHPRVAQQLSEWLQ